jgi:hypothetical protein
MHADILRRTKTQTHEGTKNGFNTPSEATHADAQRHRRTKTPKRLQHATGAISHVVAAVGHTFAAVRYHVATAQRTFQLIEETNNEEYGVEAGTP